MMHITKNVCESLLGTLFDMPEKSKDGLRARQDLKDIGIRGELQPASSSGDKDKTKSSNYCPPAWFTLDQAELAQVFKCLDGIKVTSGYSGLVRRNLDTKKHRFSGMKSHDCHVMMTQLLPVALRGVMEDHVCNTLLDLCKFFDIISRKSISMKRLT